MIPADGAPASVSDAVSALYTGWLSGAAGRLASNATGGNRNREPASVSPAGFDFDVAAVEADFAAAGRLDADGNLPRTWRLPCPAPPSRSTWNEV